MAALADAGLAWDSWDFDTARRSRFINGRRAAPREESDLQQVAVEAGATPINACRRGEVITACGVLNSVMVKPRAGVPTVEADLYDGTGHMTFDLAGSSADRRASRPGVP